MKKIQIFFIFLNYGKICAINYKSFIVYERRKQKKQRGDKKNTLVDGGPYEYTIGYIWLHSVLFIYIYIFFLFEKGKKKRKNI